IVLIRLREMSTEASRRRNLKENAMDQQVKPSPRIEPLPPEHTPELKDAFDAMAKNLGFIPNSMLILQRKPKIARALSQLTASIWEPDGEGASVFKQLGARVERSTAKCVSSQPTPRELSYLPE